METVNTTQWIKTSKELKAFVYRRVKDKALAEDIVQNVYIKIHTRIRQLKETEKLMGWIYQITRNAIIDHFRATSKTVPTINSDDDPLPLNDCVASCLSEMLITLPPKYREALELTEMQNFSQTELAERLNISYSGAKSRVQRARQILKEKMNERYNIKADSYGNILVCENKVACNCPVPFNEIKSRI